MSIYYEKRGTGPMLVIAQSGEGNADRSVDLVDDYTVVTYDRRAVGVTVTADPRRPGCGGSSRKGAIMYEENIARYAEMLKDFTEEYESFAMAIVMRDGEALAIWEVVERLGYIPSLLQSSSAESLVDIDDVTFVQANDGVLLMGDPYRIDLMDRLGGTGYRYWRLSRNMAATDWLYCRYGDQDGGIEHPDLPIPFADFSHFLGPVADYADLFQAAYDTEEEEASLDFLVVCFVVLEAETGIQFTMELINDIQQVLPKSVIDARS